MKRLYCEINDATDILSVNVNTSHSALTTATFECIDTSLDIGDEVSIYIGYVGDYAKVFTGYVKTRELTVPNNVYSVTCHDKLSRAVDYFIVSANPEAPYNFGKGILAEDLVNGVLALAGLSLYEYTPTNFEFGISNPVEVNLVSAFDYCRMIGNIVTWNLWADQNGRIYFKNRKPFFMGTEDYGQIGWIPDVPLNLGNPLRDEIIISFGNTRNEKDIRNKVVVYGAGDVYAEAHSDVTYDPATGTDIPVYEPGYYKSSVATYGFIDTTSLAQEIADYNLTQYNRIKESCSIVIEGNPIYMARESVEIDEAITGISGYWYILTAEHAWSKEGYTTSLTGIR